MPAPHFHSITFSESLPAVRLGFDLVRIGAIRESLETFGQAFRQRLFTDGELCYADTGISMFAERLAARFAAKEAVIKALDLSDAGINWRQIEVVKRDSGDCELVLHDRVAAIASAKKVLRLALSLSHEGDYAGAVVLAFFDSSELSISNSSLVSGDLNWRGFCATS